LLKVSKIESIEDFIIFNDNKANTREARGVGSAKQITLYTSGEEIVAIVSHGIMVLQGDWIFDA